MAFAPLASSADLTARNITVPTGMDSATLLASASASVREAAGCPITVAASTVALVTDDRCELDLPGGPVSAVASVTVEGALMPLSVLTNGCYSAGWRLVGNQLLFTRQRFTTPAVVTVVYTHGYPIIPADIVDLTCSLVAMAAGQNGDYGAAARLAGAKLGDWAETYVHPAGTESPSPVAIPDSVRQRLRGRFGTGTALVRFK